MTMHSMRPIFIASILAVLLGVPAPLSANILWEFNLDGGFTNNLLNDSSQINDRYSIATLGARFYPYAKTEVALNTSATYYDHFVGLSNYLGHVEVSYIPLSANSRWTIFLGGSFDGRRYRSSFNAFDNNSSQARVALGRKFGDVSIIRAGYRYERSSYISSNSADRSISEVYAGMNTTLFGRNALDIEFGYGQTDYRYVDRSLFAIDFQNPDAALIDGKLKSFFISPRFSRPIGSKVGINLTFTYREFLDDYDNIVYGSSVGLLSPWTSTWQGRSVTLSVKSYLIPNAIMMTGIGIWDREHLQTLEQDFYPLVRGRSRADTESRIYTQISRPFVFRSGAIIQPHIQVDFTNNNSTNKLFDYSGVSINTGFSLRL